MKGIEGGIRLKKFKWALAIFAILALAACGGNEEAGTDTDKAGAGNPENLYNQNCSACHGGELQGGAGPELSAVGDKYSQEEIETIILEGKGNMPDQLLEGEEAKAVAEWLASKK